MCGAFLLIDTSQVATDQGHCSNSDLGPNPPREIQGKPRPAFRLFGVRVSSLYPP